MTNKKVFEYLKNYNNKKYSVNKNELDITSVQNKRCCNILEDLCLKNCLINLENERLRSINLKYLETIKSFNNVYNEYKLIIKNILINNFNTRIDENINNNSFTYILDILLDKIKYNVYDSKVLIKNDHNLLNKNNNIIPNNVKFVTKKSINITEINKELYPNSRLENIIEIKDSNNKISKVSSTKYKNDINYKLLYNNLLKEYSNYKENIANKITTEPIKNSQNNLAKYKFKIIIYKFINHILINNINEISILLSNRDSKITKLSKKISKLEHNSLHKNNNQIIDITSNIFNTFNNNNNINIIKTYEQKISELVYQLDFKDRIIEELNYDLKKKL